MCGDAANDAAEDVARRGLVALVSRGMPAAIGLFGCDGLTYALSLGFVWHVNIDRRCKSCAMSRQPFLDGRPGLVIPCDSGCRLEGPPST